MMWVLPVWSLMLVHAFMPAEPWPGRTPMVELCDNAVDDDGDGFIDLNDPDCACPLAEPVSLIPNPSFEDTLCCPRWRSELSCAETWIQASEATTDYIHTCGWMGWDSLPPPLPFPDGEAVVGFRNGRFGQEYVPGWKEYAGACLLSPLRRGNAYRFRFNIGFTYSVNSPPTSVVFYGSTDCENLPFGTGDANFGCPTNGPGWVRLGAVYAIGANNWVEREIDIVPNEDIYAMAIGPDCVNLNATDDVYYFFDNLVLAEESAFEFQVLAEGNPCSEGYVMEVPAYDSLDYQWYRNGIALVGQTSASLRGSRRSGRYEVRITSSVECKLTRPFILNTPNTTTVVEQTICPGERIDFHGRTLASPGLYVDTLSGADLCDSIVILELDVAPAYADSLRAGFFPDEGYRLGPYTYSRPGQYTATLRSGDGCDSLIYLTLHPFEVYFPTAFSPNGDGRNDRFTVFGGPDLDAVETLRVFNRWGEVVYEGADLPPNDEAQGWDGATGAGRQAPNGVYVFSAALRMRDGKTYRRDGEVTLLR